MAMSNAVKVDAETHRLIGDLAHVLGRTRKDVLRNAVHVFASLSEASLDAGLDGAAERLALAGIRGAAGHDATFRATPVTPDAASADGRNDHEPPGAEIERDAMQDGRSRLAAARVSAEVFAAMSPKERFEARRAEIERTFADRGAHRPRFVDPTAYGYLPEPEHHVIAVDLDEHVPSLVCMELSSWLWAVAEIEAFVVQGYPE
jgi:predicted transcriptional regulator